MQTWILTFNRPLALNRCVSAFKGWTDVNIFTNHPDIGFTEEHGLLHNQGKLPILHNTLSDPESNSYCARSWNNIFLKAFKTEKELICVQDDTDVRGGDLFRDLILANKDKYDLIWGPGGDQFFYVKRKVLQTVGWFDERYLGCYCGDADWLKRVWQQYDRSRLSIYETHDWGFVHNDIGLGRYIPTDIQSKACDVTYVNQHHEIENKVGKRNRVLEHSQAFYVSKWGHMLNGTGSINRNDVAPGSRLTEIDWYPWFTEKYLRAPDVNVEELVNQNGGGVVDEQSFLKRQQTFWGDIAKTWSLRSKDPVVGWYNEHQSFPEYDTLLFRGIPLTGNEVVLEYGCGPARNIIRWNKKFKRIDGVDIAPECIEKAKIHLAAEGIPFPNLWSNDGKTLPMIEGAEYDIVFCVIALQHITSRAVRQNLYEEFKRVLKPGGYFVWQCGFGPGHPRSVDYFAESFSTEEEFVDKDFRLENVEHIKKDLEDAGFIWREHVLSRTCKDEHPAWLWGQVQKPL